MTTEEIMKEYELKKDVDCWVHKQSKKLCLLHTAHQKIAHKEGFKVEEIKPLNSTETLVRFIIVMVRLGKVEETMQVVDKTMTIGEADTKNTINAYLGCMAEKRGYDRAVRQLLGIDDVAFSEEDFTDKENQTYATNTNWEMSDKQRTWAHNEIKKLSSIENEVNEMYSREAVDVVERETKVLESLDSNESFSDFVNKIKDLAKEMKKEGQMFVASESK